MSKEMVTKRSWKEFRKSGLLWWINMILHTFGWAIVVELDESNEITEAYPARVKFRGFSEERNTVGYQEVSSYLRDNIEEVAQESQE